MLKKLLFENLRTCSVAALLLGASDCAFSQTWTNPGSGGWTTGTNWSGGVAPVSSATSVVQIDNTAASGNQTVTLNVVNSTFQVGSLSLLSTNAGGFVNTLQLTGTGGSASIFNVNSPGLVLGSATGTAEIRISPSITNAFVVLNAGAPGVTLNTGGLLTLDSGTVGNANPQVAAPVTINGGALSILGNSAAGGITATGTKSLTLNSGAITFDNNTAASTGRLTVAGNFIATGGTIAANHFAGSSNIIELSGATNSLSGATLANQQNLTFSFRGAVDQSLSSDVDLSAVTMRNGRVNTVTLTSAGKNIGQISITNTSTTTFRMGSDMNTAFSPIITTSTNSTIDLNGHTLNITSGSQWSVGSLGTRFASSTSGTVRAHSYSLGNSTVGANVALESVGSGTIQTSLGTSTVDAASKIIFSGSSSIGAASALVVQTAGQSIGSLQVGNGTSTTVVSIQNNALNMLGNLSILNGSTLDLNGRVHSLAGALQGVGTLRVSGTAGLNMTSTGGISAGYGSNGSGIGSVGTLVVSGSTSGMAVALNNSSVSWFDLAGDASNDVFNAAGNKLTLDGTLQINLIGGYFPDDVGQTWTLFTGLAAGTTGTFDTIVGAGSETYSFSIVGGNGILTLTSVPEPSVCALGLAGLLLCGRSRRRRA